MASTSKKQKLATSNTADWNLDYYKTDYESDEHWQLRRRFMEVHKDKFSEDALVCLAQVFTNVEFMGCKYPSETMRMVGELSQEVAKEFRAKRSQRLKRTFVQASDAAESRAKGRTSKQQQPQQQNKEEHNKGRKRFGTGEWENEKRTTTNLYEGLPFANFVLTLDGGRNCIRTSSHRVNMVYLEKEIDAPSDKKKVEITLSGKLVAEAVEENLKLAKGKAFTNAVEVLQKSCYSLKSNSARDKIKIDKTGDKIVCGVTKEQTENLEEKRLDASNKGYKIMKMMGWTGGGLGSKTQGRTDPIGYLLKNNRAGLGNNACKLDRLYFTNILKNYISSDDIRELQFEPTFTKDDRAILHEIAGKFNLRSVSRGKGDARSLVISKKTITDTQILTEILLNKNVSYADKYFVQVPESKAKDFPDNTQQLEL